MPDNPVLPSGSADIEIVLPTSVKKIAGASANLILAAPHLVVLLIIVGAFLFTLDRQQIRHSEEATKIDGANELRIEADHKVHERSMDALDGLTRQMSAQNEGFRQMSDSMDELADIIKQRM